MRSIAIEYFEHSPVLAFPILALALFMAVFVAVFVRSVLTNRERYEAVAALPLDEPARDAGEERS